MVKIGNVTNIFIVFALSFFIAIVYPRHTYAAEISTKDSDYLNKVWTQQIEELSEIGFSFDLFDQSTNIATSTVPDERNHFKYVAIGNSVTIHEIGDLWHGDWGMAATSKQNDYVHVLAKMIEQSKEQPVDITVISCKDWELNAERNNFIDVALKDVPSDADLVTVQTGENITTYLERLNNDYDAFFGYLRQKAPNAQILVTGKLLWMTDEADSAKRTACEKYGIQFIDMNEFADNYENIYRSRIGELIVGADGNNYAIDNECVAAHPNDDGMAKIAEILFRNVN